MKQLLLIYTRLFDPFVVICGGYLTVFLTFGTFPADLKLLFFVLTINLAIPIFYFLKLLREKKVGNWDVENKKERRKIFGPLIIFVVISTIILYLCRGTTCCAPTAKTFELWNYLLKIQLSGILLFSYLYIISPHLKSSGHVGAMCVFFPLLLKLYGFNASWFIILIVIQAVARVVLKKHTAPEVIAGFVSGTIIGSLIFFS